MPLTVLGGAVAPLGGHLAHRIPLRLFLAGGVLLIAAGAIGLTYIGPGATLSSLWPWYALIGIGVDCSLIGPPRAAELAGGKGPLDHGRITVYDQTWTPSGVFVEDLPVCLDNSAGRSLRVWTSPRCRDRADSATMELRDGRHHARCRKASR